MWVTENMRKIHGQIITKAYETRYHNIMVPSFLDEGISMVGVLSTFTFLILRS